jgi:diguanylate cyclase (GGDEF)-like protein
MERSETVVIVDDDRAIRTVIELALAKSGRTVVGFGDGQEALDFLSSADGVDLVVSDVAMEGFDAHRLLRHLRASANTAATPVIFVTAADAADDRSAGAGDRMVEHMRKPFDIAELRTRVDMAIRHGATDARPRDPLTGLHTRDHFESLLAQALAAAQPSGPPVALMIGDVSAAHGALERVAQIVAAHLRGTDFAARFGEQSIATLHPACDADGAATIANRILSVVASDPRCAGARLRLGVAVAVTPHDASADALIGAAHDAVEHETHDGATVTVRTV